MRFLLSTIVALAVGGHTSNALVSGRTSGFGAGQPIDGNGKGAPILGILALFILHRDITDSDH